jgi:hypothetical protein
MRTFSSLSAFSARSTGLTGTWLPTGQPHGAGTSNDNAATPPDPAPRSAAELAYVHERASQCCEILAAGTAWLQAQAGWHELPSRWPRNPDRERAITEASFGGWDPPERRITSADILAVRGCRLAPPPPPANGLPVLPLDNWAGDNRESFAAWNEFLDESLDWREAAE